MAYFDMDWQVFIGNNQLAMLSGIEIHKSVDLLADTCNVILPGYAYNKPIKKYANIEDMKRGTPITVKLGYNGALQTEFTGFILRVSDDNGNNTIVCEDALFLMRVPLKDKSFKNSNVQTIVQYLIDQVKFINANEKTIVFSLLDGINTNILLNCTLTLDYTKFVITKASAYDVLKKLHEETNANIYMRWIKEEQKWQLNIHPPYIETFGRVRYSFQHNIESGDNLKYLKKEDREIEVTLTNVGQDGKQKVVKFGTTGGEQINKDVPGFSENAMQQYAKNLYYLNWIDCYEGDIKTWLTPYVEPGYSAQLMDDDFDYKTGWYYVNAVTTTFDENGGVRIIQLGRKLSATGKSELPVI